MMKTSDLYDLFFIMEKNGAIIKKYIKTSALPMLINKIVIDVMEPLISSVEPAGLFPHEDMPINIDEFIALAKEDPTFKFD